MYNVAADQRSWKNHRNSFIFDVDKRCRPADGGVGSRVVLEGDNRYILSFNSEPGSISLRVEPYINKPDGRTSSHVVGL